MQAMQAMQAHLMKSGLGSLVMTQQRKASGSSSAASLSTKAQDESESQQEAAEESSGDEKASLCTPVKALLKQSSKAKAEKAEGNTKEEALKQRTGHPTWVLCYRSWGYIGQA